MPLPIAIATVHTHARMALFRAATFGVYTTFLTHLLHPNQTLPWFHRAGIVLWGCALNFVSAYALKLYACIF